LIVKHDPDEVGLTSRSGVSKSAFDNAEYFKNKLEESKIDKAEQNYQNNLKARKRGKEALEQLTTKPFEIKNKPAYESGIKEKLQKNARQRKLEGEIEKMFSETEKPVKNTLKKGSIVISK
jgi:hypothetical protein